MQTSFNAIKLIAKMLQLVPELASTHKLTLVTARSHSIKCIHA